MEKSFASDEGRAAADAILTQLGQDSIISHLMYELGHLCMNFYEVRPMSERTLLIFHRVQESSLLINMLTRKYFTSITELLKITGIVDSFNTGKPDLISKDDIAELQTSLDNITGEIRSLGVLIKPLVGKEQTKTMQAALLTAMCETQVHLIAAVDKSRDIMLRHISDIALDDNHTEFSSLLYDQTEQVKRVAKEVADIATRIKRLLQIEEDK